MFRSPPYKYLEITPKEGGNGQSYKSARCVRVDSGKETSFNDKLFEGVPQNTYFILKEKGGIETFSEEKLEQYQQQWAEICRQREEEAKRIRAEKEATGRYRWWSFPDRYKEGMVWKCEAVRIADNVEEFWSATAQVINSRTPFRKENPILADVLKKDERMSEFMESAKEGDILEYVVAYRDPMAASGDLQIVRDGIPVANYNLWVA